MAFGASMHFLLNVRPMSCFEIMLFIIISFFEDFALLVRFLGAVVLYFFSAEFGNGFGAQNAEGGVVKIPSAESAIEPNFF